MLTPRAREATGVDARALQPAMSDAGAGQPAIQPAIVVRDLRKRYAKVEAVRGVSFDVHAGTTTALLGLSEGQAIDWDFPDGSRRRLRLLEVVWQPERLSNSPSPRAP